MIRLSVLTALVLTATPLTAQATDCGGRGSGGQWIGGSEPDSDIATRDGYAEQMALMLRGDVYTGLFSLSEPTATRIEAQGRGNGDPVLTLYDAAGTEILTDDDSGGNRAARAETDLDPGQYCAVVHSFDDAPMTAFVRIARTDAEPLTTEEDTPAASMEEGDCSDAVDLGPLTEGPLTRDAAPAETAWLAFDLPVATAFTVTARNEAADPTLRVETRAGGVLAENDDHDGLNARIDLTVPQAAGRYCIALGALTDATLPISVSVSLYDPAAALADLYARGEAAPPMDGSVDLSDLGTLDARLRLDTEVGTDTRWFSVEIPEAGMILAEALATGPNGDPWLVIYDERGRRIALNDDTADGRNAEIASRIGAGTYLIGVRQLDGGTGWVRLLLERYMPVP